MLIMALALRLWHEELEGASLVGTELWLCEWKAVLKDVMHRDGAGKIKKARST